MEFEESPVEDRVISKPVVIAIIRVRTGAESAVKTGLSQVGPSIGNEDPSIMAFYENWESEPDNIRAFEQAGEEIVGEVERHRIVTG